MEEGERKGGRREGGREGGRERGREGEREGGRRQRSFYLLLLVFSELFWVEVRMRVEQSTATSVVLQCDL